MKHFHAELLALQYPQTDQSLLSARQYEFAVHCLHKLRQLQRE
jgi:hypothetical protein